MPLTINTNATAARASMHLNKNTESLRKSLSRLSSGSRITQPMDDAGGLAVSMKLESSIARLAGAHKNVQNAISFLEIQDGALDSAGKIINRMIELKGLSDDVMKNDSDSENYNREFKDLQMQIYDMATLKFNGVSMFATTVNKTGGAQAVFDNLNQSKSLDNTVSVFVSAEGNTGPIVSVSKALLLSALTVDTDSLTTGKAYVTTQQNGNYTAGDDITFAAANSGATINLSDISIGVFTRALENVATLRADNGASMSRLSFAADNISTTKTNMEAANGRIIDVDIAQESTRMAKYNILVQASASMLAQANSSSDVALMLIR